MSVSLSWAWTPRCPPQNPNPALLPSLSSSSRPGDESTCSTEGRGCRAGEPRVRRMWGGPGARSAAVSLGKETQLGVPSSFSKASAPLPALEASQGGRPALHNVKAGKTSQAGKAAARPATLGLGRADMGLWAPLPERGPPLRRSGNLGVLVTSHGHAPLFGDPLAFLGNLRGGREHSAQFSS